MRTKLVVMMLVMGLSTGAMAEGKKDEKSGPSHKRGSQLAIAGAVIFTQVWAATSAGALISDGLCGLGESHSPDGCPFKHYQLSIPLIGGFMQAAQPSDSNPGTVAFINGLGITSSILQLGGLAMMIYGIVEAHQHPREPKTARADRAQVLPYIGNGAGIVGRF